MKVYDQGPTSGRLSIERINTRVLIGVKKMRKRYSIRGLDQDVIDMIREVRKFSRTEIGELIGEAVREWYSRLPEIEPE